MGGPGDGQLTVRPSETRMWSSGGYSFGGTVAGILPEPRAVAGQARRVTDLPPPSTITCATEKTFLKWMDLLDLSSGA